MKCNVNFTKPISVQYAWVNVDQPRKGRTPRICVSKEDIVIALRELGTKKGDIVGVCTAMHLTEEIVVLPKHILEKVTPPKWFVEKYPQDEWEWDFTPYPEFSKMEKPCQKHKIMKLLRLEKQL